MDGGEAVAESVEGGVLKSALTMVFVVGGATVLLGAQAEHRFVRSFQFPATLESVVVAEGDLEPRGIGSYTVRIYGGRSANFPTDDFITGVVRPRNGVIDAVRFNDLDGDHRPEIIVLMRSTGSGGYLSADAFRYKNRSLKLIASLTDLDKAADPIERLRQQLTPVAADPLPAER
jgi:PliI/PliC-like inhibitor of I-type lysozyme